MKTLKNFTVWALNYYQEQIKVMICLLPFCILTLMLLPKPARAGECACYTFPPFQEASCFDVETQKECNL